MLTIAATIWLRISAASECRFIDQIERTESHGHVAVLVSKATGETTTIRHAPAWWREGGLISFCNK